MNKKHNISQDKTEAPICIHAAGYKVYSTGRFVQLFESLARQNYSNFHLVYVDDNSPAKDVEGMLNYLQRIKTRVNNRMKFIHTTQHIGSLANHRFFIRKYCNPEDIVVIVDADDSLIGSQALKVLNHAYLDPQIWFVYTRCILSYYNNLHVGLSKHLTVPAETYRNNCGTNWNVSALRSFRRRLYDKVPLPMMIEYHVNLSTLTAYPRFVNRAEDTYHVFNLLELAGDKHYKFITDFLYLYSGSPENPNRNCDQQHNDLDDYKSRIKTPLKTL